MLLADALCTAPSTIIADGVRRGEDAADFAPLALPAALGSFADFSPFYLGPVSFHFIQVCLKNRCSSFPRLCIDHRLGISVEVPSSADELH
jgi:hypothetical protein